ncbi:MAG: TonB-dependent receptor [Thermoanaerobaculia bacterium]
MRDTAGGALPGVSVQASSASLQGVRVGATDSEGRFRFPALPPGIYGVRAALPGFRPAEKSATVSLDATSSADLVFEPALEEQIAVTGEAPLIDSTSTTTGTNYTSGVISHLPTARNYADIVKSNPGVSTDRGTTEGRSLALTVYGATSAENQWIIDGVNTTNVFKGVQGKAINNEFVQEVEVKTGGYQAECRALGGVINVITKSGGNTFHGDGFLYYDSTSTAAERELKPGDSGIAEMRLADGERFDYGVDLGGFLLKDRLWFFGAYNRVTIQSELSRLQSSTYVSTEDRFPLDATNNLYSGKLTWNAASSTTIVGTVFADPTKSSGAAGADPRQGLGVGEATPPVSPDPSTWYSERFQGGTDFGVRATQLYGSRAIATLQGSYHKDENALTPPDGIRYEDQTCAGGTPDDPCALPFEPNSITGGYGRIFGVDDHSTSERQQYAAGLTLYADDHEIKLGGDYQNGRTTALNFFTGGQRVRIRNERGQLYYEHSFYAVSPDDPTVVPGRPLGARVLDYGVYLQDSWKAAPGLTVNLGLRWDGEQTRNYAGQTVLSFGDQWQPRLGVVWDPWRNGETKLYAFAGRFSYALPTVAAVLVFGMGTFFRTYNFDPVSVTQDENVIGHEEALGGGGAFGDAVDSGARGWYQDELTAGVGRMLGPTLTVGLKGTYRTLRNVLEDRCDLDYSFPETNFSQCGLVNPGSSGDIASGDIPTCNGLDFDWRQCSSTGPAVPSVSRIYRGLELLARKSIGTSLWLQASYVYSSLRGNYDGGVNQGPYG